ncbi:MAG TPA: hypothetical protein VM889_10310 [Candidatus Thermoplasmatota archaeon]|nr:hypothetical protein [Candidatus Thermoplasmatota archaeon]
MSATCACCGGILGADSWSLTICDEACLDAAAAAFTAAPSRVGFAEA